MCNTGPFRKIKISSPNDRVLRLHPHRTAAPWLAPRRPLGQENYTQRTRQIQSVD